MICIPITARNMESAIIDLRKAEKVAEIIELRIDYVRDLDLKKLIKEAKKPIIVTNRRLSDNGKFRGTEEERLTLIKQAQELEADFVDIEFDANYKEIIKNKKNSKVIISYHNFSETPEDIEELNKKLNETHADIIKIATKANTLSDNLKILNLIKNKTKPIIAMCMGSLGEISRILAPCHGSLLTFASLTKGKESALGQIPAKILSNIYRINDIKPDFKLYGVVGNPVGKSKGYILHNSLFKKENLNSIYLKFPVDILEEFINNFSPILAGFSVTMPFKEEILFYLDELDDLAKKIGAVNTVVNKDGKLIGYNTDITGAIKAIEAKMKIQNKNVTILGAGGASRAIAFGIIQQNGKLTILNRTVEKAKKLALEFECDFGPLKNFEKIKTDILINTTSVGMHPNIGATPIDTKSVKNMLVFDIIYNQLISPSKYPLITNR